MMNILSWLVALLSCIIGTICGMGGGIIIKPVLDATGMLSVSTITFLSGCTVIAMTCRNMSKTVWHREFDVGIRMTTILAVGAALGGLAGKELYTIIESLFTDRNTAGGVQAILLFAATLGTFLYTYWKDKIPPKRVESNALALLLGIGLGMLGAFLGIGGGPFNVAVLCYFFSMSTKKAAQNSLYIILFSQLASTLKTAITQGIPEFPLCMLIGMILCAIVGNEVGRRINKKLNDQKATLCLEGIMIVIMMINIYDAVKYLR